MSSARLQSLRGRRVSVALRDGTRVEDCQLVSVGRSATSTVWFVADGADMFVRREDLIAVWPVASSRVPIESARQGS
jgi:hypothetical protein